MRKEKWRVCGENGGLFTNLKSACDCAREVSKYEGLTGVVLIEDGCVYIEFDDGKKVYDEWNIKK